MNYKTRLTLLFVGLFCVVLTSILSFIYASYSEFRRDEFFERLREKSLTTAKLLIEVNEIDNDLLKIIDQNSIHKMYDEKVLIFDQNNKLVYSSLDDEPIPYSARLLHQIRTKADKYYVDDDGDEVVGIHYTGEGKDYVVLASAYDTYGISKLNNLKNIVILSLIIGAGLIAIASYFYIKQVFRPIDILSQSIQNINENNLHEFIPIKKDRDELDKLAVNYNRMLERLFKAFESQRAFVRNAAHELKTPMALINSKLENLASMADGYPEMQTLLNNLSNDVIEQSSLVESLLLIQRLQSQLPINTAAIRVDELLDESVREYTKPYPEQKIKVDIDQSIQSERQLVVNGNSLLLKICFRNLIENAALYAAEKIQHITLSNQADTLHLRFSNPGHEPLSTALIFEPFYRQPIQQEKPGHGLGLSIVRQITELMKGSVQYDFVDGHHSFLMQIPQA